MARKKASAPATAETVTGGQEIALETRDPSTRNKPANPDRQNVRPLAAIAADIHAAERRSIFDIGDLLLEARATCNYGEWLPWLKEEFEWGATTADNYMWAAGLRAKFPKFGNLKLTKTTIYDLADEVEDNLPGIIAELAKHATKNHLSRDAAAIVICRAGARLRWGDFPDATLDALGYLNSWDPWHAEAVAALKAKKPETDEEADAIVTAIQLPEPSSPSNEEVGAARAAALAEIEREPDEEAAASTDSEPPPDENITSAPTADNRIKSRDQAANLIAFVFKLIERLIVAADKHPDWVDADHLGERLQAKAMAFIELAQRRSAS